MKMVKFQWRPAYAGVLLLQFLLITDLSTVGLAKRGGGGGGGGRGAKGGSVGRGTSHTGGRGSQPSNVGTGGAYSAGSYGNKKPSSSLGSGGSWKTHAAAGVAGAVLGAAVSHQLTKSYYKYGHGGRDYYYGDRYYRPTHTYSKKCAYSLTESDYKKYDDGYTVKEIIFECNSRTEHCCGMECCSNKDGMPWWGILLAIVAVIFLISACVFLVMKFRKRPALYSNTGATDASVPLQGNDDITTAKAYTGPPNFYAGGPTYPAYPANSGAYSYQPAPAYGFVQPSGPYPTKQY